MKTSITTIFFSIFLIACSSKNQEQLVSSNNQDISNLLNKLIKKEREINKLTKKLIECENKTLN